MVSLSAIGPLVNPLMEASFLVMHQALDDQHDQHEMDPATEVLCDEIVSALSED